MLIEHLLSHELLVAIARLTWLLPDTNDIIHTDTGWGVVCTLSWSLEACLI